MNSTISRFDTKRRFYVLAAIGIVVVVLAGFSIDYGRLFAPASLSALVLVRAPVMFGWIGLFFVQTALIARGHAQLHRSMGLSVRVSQSFLSSWVRSLLQRPSIWEADTCPRNLASTFLAFGTTNLLTFAILVGVAIGMRRRAD